MGPDVIPLRWPATWKDPGMLGLLQATPIRHLLLGAEAKGIAEAASRAGFSISEAAPPGVITVKGLWPGIRLSPAGGDQASAGPTGVPWVDSNGWRIRAARARAPQATQFWVDARPQPSRSSAADYVVAFADAAVDGAHWIMALDDRLAAGIAAKQADDMETWKRIAQACAFFAKPSAAGYTDEAVIGVLSSLTGPKVGFTDEVLNNLARTRQLYRAISTSRFTSAALDGLKGIIYTDAAEPPADVRKQVLSFVSAGGMLITSTAWGSLPKGPAAGAHPRFAIRQLGSGAIAVATTSFSDSYLVPNDAVVLVSHRHDMVRYFNGGAITPRLSKSADKRRAVLQTAFYSLGPVDGVSLWVKGAWHSARLHTPGQPEPQNVKLEMRDSAVEIHLPAIAQYAAIELES